ncbi:hypothetical protein CW304_27240 [Bacillus sp. UFRGS-B20]|nr:hypothetical protein CW304_27240 [Bacillus sp. UFRGS-B20]
MFANSFYNVLGWNRPSRSNLYRKLHGIEDFDRDQFEFCTKSEGWFMKLSEALKKRDAFKEKLMNREMVFKTKNFG